MLEMGLFSAAHKVLTFWKYMVFTGQRHIIFVLVHRSLLKTEILSIFLIITMID